ncbi:death-associated protein 1 [Limosa lapponica baueri]|uniref:Death-associated protein 1 n=1 Tax=Limosa lapponica baueri TaxID=1758121 RepID=A0A2I0UA91_LIMLA|nr:death-associated protein 1 [Limosa lapponica baueri]
MVSTWQKAMATLNSTPTASQKKLRWEHAVYPGVRLQGVPYSHASTSSTEHTCGRCAQVEELLHLVAELEKEVSRLKSIRESRRETDYWNRTLHSLEEAQQADRTCDREGSLSYRHLAEHCDLRKIEDSVDNDIIYKIRNSCGILIAHTAL